MPPYTNLSLTTLLVGMIIIIVATTTLSSALSSSTTQTTTAPLYSPSTWQGAVLPLLPPTTTLLDISLPGTHDTTTYDLGTSIADNANSIPAELASVLHDLGPLVNEIKIGNFLRTQAFTQHLNITEQLDSGIRFIDFRVTYSAPAGVPSANTSSYEWYGIHLLQTNSTAMMFLQEIRRWLVTHPTEFVVIWVSRHGCSCCTTFQVDTPTLQRFWSDVVSLFTPAMIVNQVSNPLNTTSLHTLFNHSSTTQAPSPQVVFYLAEYTRMTAGNNYPHLAETDCNVDNYGSENVASPFTIADNFKTTFDQASSTLRADKAANNFYLVSMAGAIGATPYYTVIILLYYFEDLLQQLGTSAAFTTTTSSLLRKHQTNVNSSDANILQRYKDGILIAEKMLQKVGLALKKMPTIPPTLTGTPLTNTYARPLILSTIDDLVHQCAAMLNLTGITAWCPRTIIQSSQFKNYYDQTAFEYVVKANMKMAPKSTPNHTVPPRFPNALYLNAVDRGGTIHTGDGNLYPYPLHAWGDAPPPPTTTRGTQGYLYLDTLVLVTLLQLCSTTNTSCQAAIRQLIATREGSPYAAQYWSDPTSGRVLP